MSKQTKIHHLHRAPQLKVSGTVRLIVPELAVAIGANESIILLQIIYQMNNNLARPVGGRMHVRGGVRVWSEILPWLSRNAVHRAVKRLRDELGLITESNLAGETWYGLDWEQVQGLPGLEVLDDEAVTKRDAAVTIGDAPVTKRDASVPNRDTESVTKRDGSIRDQDQKSTKESSENTPPTPPGADTRRDLRLGGIEIDPFDPHFCVPSEEEFATALASRGITDERARSIYHAMKGQGWMTGGRNPLPIRNWLSAGIAWNEARENHKHRSNHEATAIPESAESFEERLRRVDAEAMRQLEEEDHDYSRWGYGGTIRRAAGNG